MAQIKEKIAVVTGGNRGIGFEICRQLARQGVLVVLTSRDEGQGLRACEILHKEELSIRYCPLDVDHPGSIEDFQIFIQREFGRCDILVNNAGIFPDSRNADAEDFPSIFHGKAETITRAMVTNVYGPLLLCQAIVPLMIKHDYGRIVNMSSGMGQLTDMNGGYPAYRISKTALNALTRMLNDELLDRNILVNSMCPGWVKTDMGGPGATRSVEQGADTAVWLATLPDGGPRGKFFRDRKEIPW
ncbi:MAG: SDR family oxidoreductase [Candidatus Omnitrophota bacterium]|nr:SDR family oxidoreductase [Candidatus Omnitrophota bacterium]MDZ4241897.1 SDR family oxidoreductase [Candidatus Omnitrophota bacterium]